MTSKGTTDQIAQRYIEVAAERDALRAELADLLPGMDADGMRISDLARENHALRAEIERLTAEVRTARADADDLHSHLVEKARENERLRALLKQVTNTSIGNANSNTEAILIEDECDADD